MILNVEIMKAKWGIDMNSLAQDFTVEEQWKDIEGYEGLYQVSNFGRVKSLPRVRIGNGTPYLTKSKILSKGIGATRGYCRVTLCKEPNNQKMFYVHRLVAIAFCEKIKGKDVVNHKNGIRTDNRAENLEWTTLEENLQHALDNFLNFRDEKTGKFIRKGVA